MNTVNELKITTVSPEVRELYQEMPRISSRDLKVRDALDDLDAYLRAIRSLTNDIIDLTEVPRGCGREVHALDLAREATSEAARKLIADLIELIRDDGGDE